MPDIDETKSRNKGNLTTFSLFAIITILISCCMVSYFGKNFISGIFYVSTADKINILPSSSSRMPSGYSDLYIGMKLKDIKTPLKYEGEHIYIISKETPDLIQTELFVKDYFNNALYFIHEYPGARVYCFRFQFSSSISFPDKDLKLYNFIDAETEEEIKVYRDRTIPGLIIAVYDERKTIEIWDSDYFFRMKDLI
ncbi:MAG: hypothetical protein PHV06_00820 [bacterium]|nr:hypothetical protein [bacterium]